MDYNNIQTHKYAVFSRLSLININWISAAICSISHGFAGDIHHEWKPSRFSSYYWNSNDWGLLNWVIIGSTYDLPPIWHRTITQTNAECYHPYGKKTGEIWIKTQCPYVNILFQNTASKIYSDILFVRWNWVKRYGQLTISPLLMFYPRRGWFPGNSLSIFLATTSIKFKRQNCVNILFPRQWPDSKMVSPQKLARHLFDAKPLLEPMLIVGIIKSRGIKFQ